MHLYLATRGVKHEVDQFITELQGKYLPFKWRDLNKPDSKLEDCHVQLGVRPIQLWEIVFPEEQRDVVLATILQSKKGEPEKTWHKKFIWAIRKILGSSVMPIPEYNNDKKMPIRCQGIELVGIGVKSDYWVDRNGNKVDKKEEGAFEGL